MTLCEQHGTRMLKSKYHSLYCPTCMDIQRTNDKSRNRLVKNG